MALVAAAAGADDLRSDHSEADVADGLEMALSERRGEARPAGAAFELGAAVEQRQPAQAAGVNAIALLIEEDAAERRFGAVLEQHPPLVVAEIGGQLAKLVLARRGQIEARAQGGGGIV